MARRNSNKYKKQLYESAEPNNEHETSVVIYDSMMNSKAWKALTNNARVLYQYMKKQQFGQKDIKGFGKEYFYFNKGMWKKGYENSYELYSNQNQFYKDRDMLIENGFIETAQRGQNTRTKDIYRLSTKWNDRLVDNSKVHFGGNKNDTS